METLDLNYAIEHLDFYPETPEGIAALVDMTALGHKTALEYGKVRRASKQADRRFAALSEPIPEKPKNRLVLVIGFAAAIALAATILTGHGTNSADKSMSKNPGLIAATTEESRSRRFFTKD